MGDSDDEFDRRRRDKFRRERSDMERSREREERRRDDWPERDWDRGRERRRDYERGRRERFSPPRHMSPQHKRMRRDWDDHRGEPYRFEQPFGGGAALFPRVGPQGWPPDIPQLPMHPGAHPLQGRLALADPDLPPPGPPTMRSFKDFLLNTEDSVDETEAVKRYNQYKVDFRRQRLQDFFVQHKEQEWFRSKYHPDDIAARKAESMAAFRRRLGVFLFLWDNKWLDDVALDTEYTAAIIKVLDAAVIKMEGGTDLDLKVLEPGKENVDGGQSAPGPGEEAAAGEAGGARGKKGERNGDDEEEEEEEEQEEEDEEEEKEEEPEKGRKRKRSMSADSGEGSASDSSQSDSEKEPASLARPRPLHLTTSLFIRSVPPDASKEEIAALCRRYPGFLRVALSDPQPDRGFFRRCWLTFDRAVNIKETCWNLQNIRVTGLSDATARRPTPSGSDRSRLVPTRALSSTQLRDCELAPVVNRDLCRRVRSVNGLTQHKPVARNDVRLAARLVHALDQRAELWQEQTESNPVLKNITDYLIEEVSAEEEELTGCDAGDAKEAAVSSEACVETDKSMLKVLDTLLLYLRVVHSLDYYNFCQYPAEDHMPHRCGLIHVRGSPPVAKITATEVGEHLKMCEERLSPLLSPPEAVSTDDAARLGKKDPEQEVEKFLVANTQELSKDKWLCPLSGKKFKAPEFVRKHILNKHGDKVEGVRQEVEYFNNYLMDAKRPALPESKPAPPNPAPVATAGFPAQSPQQQSLLGYPPGVRPLLPGFAGAPPYPAANQFGAGRGHYDNFRGFPGKQPVNRGTRGDPRSIIEYRDLDAPDDLDFF
ncbi:serrate RNA effector molecule homolog isoform X2 [Stigmatopora argus]